MLRYYSERGDNMQYLNVGTSVIDNKKFIQVNNIDNELMKPSGGMWFTKYQNEYKNYNEWVDFLIDNPNILFFKNHSSNIWQQSCLLITLNKDSKIYTLDSYDSWQYLLKTYPYNETKFSYQKLSKEFDCIYVDIRKLSHELKDDNLFKLVRQYSVSSLLLFNLNCINYYQSGVVKISPFDLEYQKYENIAYEIEIENHKKNILKK